MNIFPLFICLFVALFGAIIATGGGGGHEASVGSIPIDVTMAESSSVHVKGGEQTTIQLLFVKGKEKLDDGKEKLDEGILEMNYEAARLPYTTNEWIQENEGGGGVNAPFSVPEADSKSLRILIKWCEQHQDKVPTPKAGEAESWRKTDDVPDWVMGISSNLVNPDPMIKFVEEMVKQKKETEAKKMEQTVAGASAANEGKGKGGDHKEEVAMEDAEDEKKRETARVPKWANLLMKTDLMTFFQLIKVTSYMDVKVLLNILTETVRFNLMWRTPEYIESVFGVHPFPNEKKQEEKPVYSEWAFELTPEEEEAMQMDAIGDDTVTQPELTVKG